MDAAATIVGVVEKLFGKVGAALLLATGAFFLSPRPLLGLVGLDNTDPDLRRTFGYLFLFSLAACAVAITIKCWDFCSAKFPGWWDARRIYGQLPKEARIVLGQMEMLGEPFIVLRADNSGAQDLIDAGLLRVGGRLRGDLRLVRGEKYREFVTRYRKDLRALMAAEGVQATSMLTAVKAALRYQSIATSAHELTNGQKGPGK